MYFNPLKKNVVRDAIKENLIAAPPKLQGGVYYYGRIGSGKTVTLLSICGKYHDNPARAYKIFDLWGGDRYEQYYWALPSEDINYWDKMKKKLNLDNEGPKQYKVNLLFPMSKNLPDKLPNNPPYVFSKVFTIPTSSITIDDIQCSIGSLAVTNESSWKNVVDKLKKKDDAVIAKELLEKEVGENTLMYKSFFMPLYNEGVLQSEDCEFNLDLKAELKDQETITVLSLEFVDKEYRVFFLQYILRNMAALCDRFNLPQQVIPIREASEFFRATDQAIVPERMKVFKAFLSQYVRMGRRGMHLFLETQSPSETRGMVDSQQDITFIGKLPGEADRAMATDQLKRDNLITLDMVRQLSILEPGQMVISEVSKLARMVYVPLPRCAYWKEGYKNFLSTVWTQKVNRWSSIKEEKDKMKEAMEATIKRLKDEKELQRKLKKEEEEAEKLEDFEKRERQKMEIKDKMMDIKRKLRDNDIDENEDGPEDDAFEDTEQSDKLPRKHAGRPRKIKLEDEINVVTILPNDKTSDFNNNIKEDQETINNDINSQSKKLKGNIFSEIDLEKEMEELL